jgi:hypothetical protein
MSDKWVRCVTHWLGICAVAVCGVIYFLNSISAEEKEKKPPFDEGFISVPGNWRQIGVPASTEVLDMVADQTQGNYEKLRTWQGDYRVHMRQYLPNPPGGATKELLSKRQASDKLSQLWQEFDFTLRFAIDMESDSIYRSKETKTMLFVKDGSNETVTIPNVGPADERSVVTAEHYLHFDPKAVSPGFTYVPNHPDTHWKRTAFRDAHQRSERQHSGDLPDPREVFGLTGGMKFWKEVRMLSQAIKAGKDFLVLHEGSGLGGTWYQLVESFMSSQSGKPSGIYMTVIFSPTAGFNAVSVILAADKEGKRPISKRLWQWKMFNGVFVPEKIVELRYSAGNLVYQREMNLQECAVNDPLKPNLFSYQGLGMKDGDLVMDNIDKVCYIIKDGSPQTLANYGEQYTPPGPGVGVYLPQWKVTVCSGLLVILIAIFIVRRYRKRRRKSSSE